MLLPWQDKDRVHILESAVVQWTERINYALSRHPESVFNNDQHPGPQVGIDFWQQRMTDLGEILEQLRGQQIVKVLKVLEIIRSPYFQAFKNLISSLEIAHAEAKDNVKYLSSLSPYFTNLLSADFETIGEHLKPIMHVLLMIWKHSKFYNTPPNLALLMRMLCNSVIEKSRDFMGSAEELLVRSPRRRSSSWWWSSTCAASSSTTTTCTTT